jgi:hypothetical protein
MAFIKNSNIELEVLDKEESELPSWLSNAESITLSEEEKEQKGNAEEEKDGN